MRTYTYVPRADGAGYIAQAPAQAPPAQQQQQAVPGYYYPGQSYQWTYPAYYYPQYYPQHQYPTYTYAPAAASPAPAPAQPTYTYSYPGHHYYYPSYAAAPTSSGHYHYGQTKAEVDYHNRRIATERGAYEAKKIKPDAKPDDVFWCKEKDGNWYVRSYYNIENDCQPGRWQMDAEKGYCVFHRE